MRPDRHTTTPADSQSYEQVRGQVEEGDTRPTRAELVRDLAPDSTTLQPCVCGRPACLSVALETVLQRLRGA